jgi:protease-4
MMELNGLSAQYTFYKGSMEKLEVKPEIFRVGEFKSAVEPFLLDKMSEANREQTASFLNSIYNYVLKNIANARKISVVELRRISDEFLVRKPEDALKYKLVTHLAYYDEVEAEMKKKLGLKEKDKINFVNHNEYEKVPATEKEKYSENKIAVIIGEGDIQSGNSTDESIGSETIAQEIRRARLDKNIKAIVLRINSPGGSALASDVMWREVIEAKKVKPVIASMSDVAASGGYYMAMGCDAIVAQPTTITGSIGIFGMLFNAEGLYKNKLGMSSDRVSTGKFADIRSAILDRSLTEQEREMIQNWVNEGYEDFTAKAAKGRKMSHEDLKKVASGRVWSGVEAKERGLVDKLGSFEDAIVLAAEKAKLKKGEYRLRYYPAQKTFVEKVTELLNAEAKAEKLLNEKLGALYPALQILEKMKRQEVMQARMGFEMEIR